MANDFEETVRQSKGNVVDLILREEKWQDELIEFLDEYGDNDNHTATICGKVWSVKIVPQGDVAVRLVLVRVETTGGVWWKTAEKTLKTTDEFKAEWLKYLEENNLPLHDPAKEVKETKPFSIL